MHVARRTMNAARGIPMDSKAFRRLCVEHDTNATRVATELGMNRNTITNWMRGTQTPNLNHAYAVAALLGTDVLTLWPDPNGTAE